MKNRPIIGITMGDPVSIGPEISIKAFLERRLYDDARLVIIGDAKVMKLAVKTLKLEQSIQINPIGAVEEARFEFGIIDVIDLNTVDMEQFHFGKISAMAGETAFRCVEKVIQLAMQGKVDATVTNALNKEAIKMAGYDFAGHTEIYASMTQTEKYTMMLAHEDLRVVHVSTHVSLREACDRVKKDRVLEVIEIAHTACKNLGIESPKIGVAGLNPHAGENGLFGREEIEEIVPAIEDARQQGIHVEGPIPPDTIFSKARGGWYDVVVAMYHDQGHIPLKLIGFEYDRQKQEWKAVEGVNITIGLPIIRTSVDHGTAYDRAGKGDANPLSLINAIDYAIALSKNRS